MVNTGIYLEEGSLYSILSTFSAGLLTKVGDGSQELNQTFPTNATSTGYLFVSFFNISRQKRPTNINIDIIEWKKEDYVQIANFFERMKEKDPKNKPINYAYDEANRLKKYYVASKLTMQKIKETKKEIQDLEKEPVHEKKEKPVKFFPVETSPTQVKPSMAGKDKAAQLEAELLKLKKTLSQLEEMKNKLEEEREKTNILTKELEDREKKERELRVQIKDHSKRPPIIVIASPREDSRFEVNRIQIIGVAEDDQSLARLEIFINGETLNEKMDRGIKLIGEIGTQRVEFKDRIPIEKGINQIKIVAVDVDGLSTEKILTVHYVEKRRNVWAVVAGINNYLHTRSLKYAVSDAKLFYDYLTHYNNIPKENVSLLLDQQATLTQLRSTMGTHLKNRAGKDDMVIIFFAGHGATEKDVTNPDGDGLEKYLLPYDADPNDLYATALPMREISHIFNRIQSERLVFIADSCYSGASGGRTIGVSGIRANISASFLDRVASGKGRVIITASGPNEVSVEKDEIQHGVFTYYLVEGLRGKADSDKDGQITVDEAYGYVSEQVPKATGNEQHPVKKGIVEGRLTIGIVDY
jgi:hypothetical protein